MINGKWSDKTNEQVYDDMKDLMNSYKIQFYYKIVFDESTVSGSLYTRLNETVTISDAEKAKQRAINILGPRKGRWK